jgi:hypothetical protein
MASTERPKAQLITEPRIFPAAAAMIARLTDTSGSASTVSKIASEPPGNKVAAASPPMKSPK